MEFDVDGQVSLFILHIYSKAIETGITLSIVDVKKKNFYGFNYHCAKPGSSTNSLKGFRDF